MPQKNHRLLAISTMLSNDATRADTPALTAVVPGLSVLRDVFVNLYYAFPQD